MTEELKTRESRIEAAAVKALWHIEELADAWLRGAIREHDGKGGTRSNRNHELEIELRAALAPLPKHCVGRSIPAGTESSGYALEDEQQRLEFAKHKYVEHSTYTGSGCAMCGKTEVQHS